MQFKKQQSNSTEAPFGYGALRFSERRRRRARASANGFTLIELLVALLIIAILAAILIPAIGGARQKALMSESVGNLRSLGVLYRLYSQEHNNQFPGTIQEYNATNESGSGISNNDISTISTYGYRHSPHLLLLSGYVDNLDSFYDPAQTTYTYPDDTTSYGRSGWAKEGFFIGYVHYRLRKYGGSGADAFPERLQNKSANSDPRLPLLSTFFPGVGTEEPLYGDTLNFVRVDGSVGQMSIEEFLSSGSWTGRLEMMIGER